MKKNKPSKKKVNSANEKPLNQEGNNPCAPSQEEGMRLIEESFKTKIPVDLKVALAAIFKISRCGLIKFLRLICIDPYLFFSIGKSPMKEALEKHLPKVEKIEIKEWMCSPGWMLRYVEELVVYWRLFNASINFLRKFNNYSSEVRMDEKVLVPVGMLRLAHKLPDISVTQIKEVLRKHLPELEETKEWMSSPRDAIIVADVLDRLLSEGKINQEFWSQAFKDCSEKEVVKKFFKDKEEQPLQSESELPEGWGRLIPKELVSYIRTTSWRLKQELEKQKPKYCELKDSIEDDSSLEDLYSFIEEEAQLAQIDQVVKTELTEKEKEVIHLRYGKKKLTQQEIARRLKISQPKVAKHEQKAYQKLAKFYKIHPKS